MISRRAAVIVVAAACFVGSASIAKQVGERAPEFSRPDSNGKPLRLSEFRGKLILLNFWASWCGPCLEEMPRFSQWQRSYGNRGLQVVGVAMDDDRAAVSALLKRQPVEYPIALGDAALGEAYGGVLGLPLTYLIGPDGRILARYQGEYALDELEAAINRALTKRRW